MELIEQLDGTVMRDQRAPAHFENKEKQRKSLHRSARIIRDEAALRRPDVSRLKAALECFEQAIEPSNWSATMLYEVFDIPFIPSTAVDAPELFNPLRKAIAMRDRILTLTTDDFEALSQLPVRVRARTNVVRNHALEQSLISCRTFWLRHSPCLGWSRSTLSDSVHLDSNASSQLAGDCERFVVDMLTASGVRFKFRSLNGAWSAFDKRLAVLMRGTSP